MHMFHMYALQDRIDFSSYSDTVTGANVDVDKLLINEGNINELISNVISLVSWLVSTVV